MDSYILKLIEENKKLKEQLRKQKTFKRGDIVYVQMTTRNIEKCSIEVYSRPYLIVSNDVGNYHSDIVLGVPLITNEEIEKIGKTYNLYIEEVVKAVTHDKEMIILHTIIKEQKRRMDEIKELIKYASDCDSPTLGKILKVLEE